MPNLAGPAQLHLTVTDGALPADAGSVTPAAPRPDPAYSNSSPTGSGDRTGSGRRSGLVHGDAEERDAEEGTTVPVPVVESVPPEQADTRTSTEIPAPRRKYFIMNPLFFAPGQQRHSHNNHGTPE